MPLTSMSPNATTCDGSSSSATMISGPCSGFTAPGRDTLDRWELSRITTSRTSLSRSRRYSSLVRAKSDVYSFSRRCSAACAVKPILGDPGADLLGKGGVPQNRLVDPEDGGFVVPHRRFHFGLQGAQVGRGALPSRLVLRQLGRHLLVFEALGVRIYENLMDAVGDSDSDARGNGDSFSHAAQCSNRPAG